MQACTKTSLARWIKLPAVSNGKSLEKAEVAKLFVDPDGAERFSRGLLYHPFFNLALLRSWAGCQQHIPARQWKALGFHQV